jgi:hypothetical protein
MNIWKQQLSSGMKDKATKRVKGLAVSSLENLRL